MGTRSGRIGSWVAVNPTDRWKAGEVYVERRVIREHEPGDPWSVALKVDGPDSGATGTIWISGGPALRNHSRWRRLGPLGSTRP